MKISILSDSHSFIDNDLLSVLEGSDLILHAGDIGDLSVTDRLSEIAPVKAVYGNIDGAKLRREFKENLQLSIEGINVFMTHIGGKPPTYTRRVRNILNHSIPDLFICGHSHILRVMKDPKYAFLYINPGATGHHGFHRIRTFVRLELEKGRIHSVEAVELGFRGRKSGVVQST